MTVARGFGLLRPACLPDHVPEEEEVGRPSKEAFCFDALEKKNGASSFFLESKNQLN